MASPELSQAAAELGIQFSPTGNAYNDPSDLPVWTDVTPYARGATPHNETVLSSKLKRSFYNYSPQDLQTLQKRLWAGGFYPRGADPDNVILGVHDELTYAAYETLVDRAASFTAAGQRLTPDDVLDQAAGVYDQINAAKGRRSGSGPGDGSGGAARTPLSVDLTDPTDLRAIAQRAAVSALGRALRDDELNRFVTSFQGREANAQSSAYATAETGGTSVAPPSAGAAAEEFVQGVAPTESGGHAFLRTYQAFSNLISRGAR